MTITAVNSCGSDSHTWQLTVTPIKCLTVSPTVLDFGTIPCGGSVTPKTVVLTNAQGCDPASGDASITEPWINVSPTTYDLNSSNSQSFDIWPDTTLLDQDYPNCELIVVNDASTDATARLVIDGEEIVASGIARRNPDDPDMPRIGDELAVARALLLLARELSQKVDEGIAAYEGHEVHVSI